MSELPLATYCHNLCLWSLRKDLFRELQVLEICYTDTEHYSRLNTSYKYKKTEPT